jgi:tetratricopeptide (TPR) repeat protein
MGILLKSQNRLEEALNALQTAIALDRNGTGALFQMGMVLTNLGRPVEATPQIEKSIQLNPRAVALATRLYALGYAHLMLGHVDKAINLLRQARAENLGLFYVHFALAGALGLKGDLEEAKLELTEAIRLKPEYNTLKRYTAGTPWVTDPKGWALRDKTLNVGLRNAGMPDE